MPQVCYRLKNNEQGEKIFQLLKLLCWRESYQIDGNVCSESRFETSLYLCALRILPINPTYDRDDNDSAEMISQKGGYYRF